MRALGIDPSKSCTGFAQFDGEHWRSGALRCPVKRPKDERGLSAPYTGAVLDWYAAQLWALIVDLKPDCIAIEEPLATTSGAGKAGAMPMQTVHLMNCIAGEAARVATKLNVPAVYVHQQVWRRAFGVKAKGRREKKQAALDICRIEGIPVQSDDEAEAVGIARWLYGTRTQTRFSRVADTPLFAGEVV